MPQHPTKPPEQNTEVIPLQELGRMTRGMVHDFNNSLAAILGYSEFLVSDLDASTEQHLFATNIHKAAEQMQIMLRQMSAMTSSLRCETSAPLELIATIETIVTRYFDEYPSSFQGNLLSPDSDVLSQIPIIHLQTILFNILQNARDAITTPSQSITVHITTDSPADTHTSSDLEERAILSPTSPNPLLYLSVTDTGCGMTSDILQIAEQPHITTKPAEIAHGIGLSVVYSMIKECGGGFTIKSAPHKGTSIIVSLPYIDKFDYDAITQTHFPQHIVLIEDRDMLRLSLKTLLIRAGHTVHDFVEPYTALDYMRENIDDITFIVCDAHLPDMSGYDVYEDIRHDLPITPFVFISGGDETHSIASLKLQDKHTDFLQKPFTTKRFLQIIQALTS